MSRRASRLRGAFGSPYAASACLLLAGVVVACGRRATDADCQLIVDKSVELQMKEMSESNPRAIADREQQVRTALEPEIKSCESRHVTDKTIGCVRAATTSRELEACLQ